MHTENTQRHTYISMYYIQYACVYIYATSEMDVTLSTTPGTSFTALASVMNLVKRKTLGQEPVVEINTVYRTNRTTILLQLIFILLMNS